MIALTFTVHLTEPLLATALEGDPNSAVSLSFIPGSVLRGAVIARYLESHPLTNLAEHPAARTLFLSGETRYLNAYPLSPEYRRSLPTPLAWKLQKGSSEPIYDLSVDPDGSGEEDWQPKAIRHPFCDLTDNSVWLFEPERQVQIHTQRDRVMGRATDSAGAVFRYEALAPLQNFAGIILCPDEATCESIKELLEKQPLLLGGSHSAGYGLASIHDVKVAKDWNETSMVPGPIEAGESFALTLLSDALLRDDHGQLTAFLSAEMVSKDLNDVSVEPIISRTHAKAGVVGGFNRKWGLPLTQMLAARAGSVFTFTAKDEVSRDALAKLVESGIGERRGEGFGRIAVNWHGEHDRLTIVTYPLPASTEITTTLSVDSAGAARRMAERMLRRELDRRLLDRVNSSTLEGGIRNAQLSGIRTLVRTAISTGDPVPVKARLQEMKATAGEQLAKARVRGDPLDQWILDKLDAGADDEGRRLFGEAVHPKVVGGVEAAWTKALAVEYALRFVDGVLSRKLAERREEV